MFATIIWLLIFALGANLIFAEGLALWPDFLIVKSSHILGWLCLWAIAGFLMWCFAEE
ncbi:hypothetical protein [[Leptolyngbya] sp. PCC 7376]|uniref:hypothetical protein n=1 Tax=[Leptolyngbya] sp. PCC 7376 TaxID=111781 RepID=UPI0002E45A76|nr:hypothetical protein [[Leptolyngbya] sp. PCC 7376]